jgi:hypothetical protein
MFTLVISAPLRGYSVLHNRWRSLDCRRNVARELISFPPTFTTSNPERPTVTKMNPMSQIGRFCGTMASCVSAPVPFFDFTIGHFHHGSNSSRSQQTAMTLKSLRSNTRGGFRGNGGANAPAQSSVTR